ncbi:cupin domain-containing protein [Shinella sumterensis]|uniref:cupin domain-containing protein n=1 Tax=Shinella sumterensis TaxID=1967501 RepID=UPI003F86DE81
MRLIAGVMIAMAASTMTASSNENTVVVRPVTRTTTTMTGQPISLPGNNPEVTVSIYEIPPGAKLPQHRHPNIRYGYMLSGHLRVTNADTGSVSDFKTGDFIVESLGQWHSAVNPDNEPIKLLVIDQAAAGATIVEPRP